VHPDRPSLAGAQWLAAGNPGEPAVNMVIAASIVGEPTRWRPLEGTIEGWAQLRAGAFRPKSPPSGRCFVNSRAQTAGAAAPPAASRPEPDNLNVRAQFSTCRRP
jgi:hypothetical protein